MEMDGVRGCLMQARRCDACSAPVVSVLCASEEAREDGAARAGQRTSTHCGTPAQLCADQCRGSTRCTPTPTRWQWRCNELSRATGSGRAQTKGSRSWHSCRCCHTPPLPSRTGRIGTLKGSKPHSSQAIRVARCTATITAARERARLGQRRARSSCGRLTRVWTRVGVTCILLLLLEVSTRVGVTCILLLLLEVSGRVSGYTRESKLVSALTAVAPFPALAPPRFLSTLFIT
jgi:hypothetical protein